MAKKIYFDCLEEVRKYLQQKGRTFAESFIQTKFAQVQEIWFKTANELGYNPRYVVVQGVKKFDIEFYVELPEEVTLEDRVKIEHSHQGLDRHSLNKIIELKTKQ